MATPVVTGIMALWLQADTDLTSDDVHRITMESAKIDATAGLTAILAGTDLIHAGDNVHDHVYDRTSRTLTLSGMASSITLYAINGCRLWSVTDCNSAILPATDSPAIVRIQFADGTIKTIKVI